MKYSDLARVTKLVQERQEIEKFISGIESGKPFTSYIPGGGSIGFSSDYIAPSSLAAEFARAATVRISEIDIDLSAMGISIDGPIMPSGDEAIDSAFGIHEDEEYDEAA